MAFPASERARHGRSHARNFPPIVRLTALGRRNTCSANESMLAEVHDSEGSSVHVVLRVLTLLVMAVVVSPGASPIHGALTGAGPTS